MFEELEIKLVGEAYKLTKKEIIKHKSKEIDKLSIILSITNLDFKERDNILVRVNEIYDRLLREKTLSGWVLPNGKFEECCCGCHESTIKKNHSNISSVLAEELGWVVMRDNTFNYYTRINHKQKMFIFDFCINNNMNSVCINSKDIPIEDIFTI